MRDRLDQWLERPASVQSMLTLGVVLVVLAVAAWAVFRDSDDSGPPRARQAQAGATELSAEQRAYAQRYYKGADPAERIPPPIFDAPTSGVLSDQAGSDVTASARRFLVSYLPLLTGRRPTVEQATDKLRAQLRGYRPSPPPAWQDATLTLVSVRATAEGDRALVQARYRMEALDVVLSKRVLMRRQPGGDWLADAIDQGDA